MTPLVNAGGMAAFGRRNLILTGAGGRKTPVVNFTGPLSIKSVLSGRVEWRTPEARFRVSPDAFVLLNDGQEYWLSPAAEEESRTFCAFFETGFVEQAVRQRLAADEELLDDPEALGAFGFHERLTPASSRTGRVLARLAAAVAAEAPGVQLDWLFHELAEALACAALEQRREPQRLPAARRATRLEIHRRLLRARAAIEDDLAAPWTLRTMARRAAMAPHHFARNFGQCFGEPPRAYLARRRLERAHALLRTGRYTATQVCLEVGYSSLGSFSSAFRTRFGRPPSSVVRARGL